MGEFGRISGLNRSLSVCTTVVQLGILRLIDTIIGVVAVWVGEGGAAPTGINYGYRL